MQVPPVQALPLHLLTQLRLPLWLQVWARPLQLAQELTHRFEALQLS